MRHYEVVAVIHPDQQGRIAAMIDLYKKIVSEGGGVLHRLEDWGRRPLAYPIQNQHRAQYVLMNIECENDTLAKLRETFKFSDFIMRSMVVRRERAITEKSPIMVSEEKSKAAEAESKAAPVGKAAAPPAAADTTAATPAATTNNGNPDAAAADKQENEQ